MQDSITYSMRPRISAICPAQRSRLSMIGGIAFDVVFRSFPLCVSIFIPGHLVNKLLRPAGESPYVTFPLIPLHDAGEFASRDSLQDLTEQTGGLYHRSALLAVFGNWLLKCLILQSAIF